MKTSIEDKGTWQKAIAITLEPGEVEEQMEKLVTKYRKKATLPGFRKGKVPDDMVRSAYRSSIESDLLQEILPTATEKAIAEYKLNVATTPRIEDLKFRPGEPLSFTAVVELWPIIEIDGYDQVKIDEETMEVDDQAIDEFLHVMRERSAALEPVSRPAQEGDVVEVTLQGVDQDGKRLPRAKREEVRMEAGGRNLLPEFREATVGIGPGESKVVRVQYPEEFGDKELAGHQRFYLLKIRQVSEKKLPELDDSFAQAVDGTADLEALRAKIRLRMEGEERLNARKTTEEKVIDRLLELNPVDVPAGMLERSLQSGIERARQDDPEMDEEKFRLTFTPRVSRMWKRRILLDSIAQKESITVADDELEERIRSSAGEGVDPRRLRKRLVESGDLDQLRQDMLEEKIIESTLEKVEVHRIQKPRQRKPQSNIIIP